MSDYDKSKPSLFDPAVVMLLRMALILPTAQKHPRISYKKMFVKMPFFLVGMLLLLIFSWFLQNAVIVHTNPHKNELENPNW